MFQQAKREKLKALVAFMGASGSGKTFSSLVLAKGMVKDMFPDLDDKSPEFWSKIAVIDTEHNRSKIYADTEKHGIYIGNFMHKNLQEPFTPEKYMEGIDGAESGGIEVLIIDSTSHLWKNLLAYQQDLGGRYQDWRKPDELYQNFISNFTTKNMHIIATMRSKQKYAMEESETGKLGVAKLGEQPVMRDDLEYEFLTTFLLDQEHNVTVTKDNTPIFEALGNNFKIKEEHGQDLAKWLEKGVDVIAEKKAKEAKEQEEKEDMIKSIEAFLESNHKIIREYTDKMIKKVKKSYKELNNMPINRLQDFLNNLHDKEQMAEKKAQEETEEATEELNNFQDGIDGKTVEGLKEVAKSFGIKGYSSMKKDELIAAIKEAQNK